MHTASPRPLTSAGLYSKVYKTAKALSCNYVSVLLFHRCDRLAWHGDASECNEGKRSVVAGWMQNKVFVDWGNSENYEWDFGYLGCAEAAVRKYKWCNVRCFTATYKNNGVFSLSTLAPYLTKLSKVNQENVERWMIWLTRVCQVAWRFERCRKISKLIAPYKIWRQEWINQLPHISLPGKVYTKMPRK